MNIDQNIKNNVLNITWYQYAATITACLTALACGMHYGWTSPALPKLLGSTSMTNEQGSWVVVSYFIGSLFGVNISGYFVDIIGRKTTLLLTTVPFMVSWIMLAFVTSVELIITGRFISGVGDGTVFCVLPMYLSEIANPRIRGFLFTGYIIMLTLGILLINVIGSCFDITTGALISITTPVLALVTFSWMPESPYYLIMRNKVSKAKQSLILLIGKEDASQELDRLTKAVEQQMQNTGKFCDLFTVPSNRKALYLLIGLRNAHQLAGTVAITFYAQTIFHDSGYSITPTVSSIIYFSVQLIVCCFSSIVVDRMGRKPLLIFSMLGISLCLLVEGCYFYLQRMTSIDTTNFSWIPMVALILFVIAFSVGIGPAASMVISELFPTNVKAFAMSFSGNYFFVTAILVSKFFQFTKDQFGMHVPFITFAICCFVGFVYIKVFVPETKGKTLEEIQDDLIMEMKQPRSEVMIQKA